MACRALLGVVSVHDPAHLGDKHRRDGAGRPSGRPDASAPDDAFLVEAARGLRVRFGIAHRTLQVERGDAAHPCALAPAEVA